MLHGNILNTYIWCEIVDAIIDGMCVPSNIQHVMIHSTHCVVKVMLHTQKNSVQKQHHYLKIKTLYIFNHPTWSI